MLAWTELSNLRNHVDQVEDHNSRKEWKQKQAFNLHTTS